MWTRLTHHEIDEVDSQIIKMEDDLEIMKMDDFDESELQEDETHEMTKKSKAKPSKKEKPKEDVEDEDLEVEDKENEDEEEDDSVVLKSSKPEKRNKSNSKKIVVDHVKRELKHPLEASLLPQEPNAEKRPSNENMSLSHVWNTIHNMNGDEKLTPKDAKYISFKEWSKSYDKKAKKEGAHKKSREYIELKAETKKRMDAWKEAVKVWKEKYPLMAKKFEAICLERRKITNKIEFNPRGEEGKEVVKEIKEIKQGLKETLDIVNIMIEHVSKGLKIE